MNPIKTIMHYTGRILGGLGIVSMTAGPTLGATSHETMGTKLQEQYTGKQYTDCEAKTRVMYNKDNNPVAIDGHLMMLGGDKGFAYEGVNVDDDGNDANSANQSAACAHNNVLYVKVAPNLSSASIDSVINVIDAKLRNEVSVSGANQETSWGTVKNLFR